MFECIDLMFGKLCEQLIVLIFCTKLSVVLCLNDTVVATEGFLCSTGVVLSKLLNIIL